MSMFKIKNKKQLPTDNRITLDAKHTNMIKYFKDLQKSLPVKKQQLKDLKSNFNELNRQSNKNLSNEQLHLKYKLQNDINTLTIEIKKIEDRDEENNYYLNTGDLLLQYYDNVENSKLSSIDDIVADSSGQNSELSQKENLVNSKNSSNILDFFSGKVSDANANSADSDKVQRADILDNYMKIIDPNYIHQSKFDYNYDKCRHCNIEKKVILNEGFMVCEQCGDMNYIIADSDKPNYKEPPAEISYFAYKRSNHFNELIAQTQAKESTEIPQDVIDKIMIEIKKERITNMVDVTPPRVRKYLKKLGYNKYYEHIAHIICRLNGRPPISISPEIEEKLRRMFREIQEPFMVARNTVAKQRRNFLSYSYLIHKFLELLGLDQLAATFVVLRNREKLLLQDQLWKNICGQLGWQFIRTI